MILVRCFIGNLGFQAGFAGRGIWQISNFENFNDFPNLSIFEKKKKIEKDFTIVQFSVSRPRGCRPKSTSNFHIF